ncbi:hypothetical protein DQ04_01771110 [Trypanosoma grayi]|uniref:hypothetical protein n=1 Tax=Trypanosoma grayi TaxID=71804 RepID=UPI0004F42CD4|nr:hypothetical protein DQ04_01771110 [Trypanosoma grayi]KEG12363.1 hypothetical protein DQ04_01771110 [Trypanosoma grayi]
MCRLSRLLQTDSFLSIDEIKQRAVGILQSPLLQVAMTYPERIVLQLGPTIDIEAAEEDRLYLGGASRCEVHEVLGVKFVLSDEEVAQHLRSRSGRLSDLTDEQLREERVKLKELQPLRRQKFRRAIVREEFRRRYPHGNPFLNPDVVALHIYDQMVPGVWVNSATLRETLLPDGGKGAMHVGVDFFDKYPHLFITQSVTTTSVNVMRREQDMEDVQSDGDNWNSMVFRDEDILLLLLPRLSNKRDDWGDNKWIEVLTALLPRHVFKYMQRRRGGAVGCLETILRRYPEAFEVMEVAQTNCIEKPRVKVRLHQDGIMRLGPKLLNELHGAGKGEDLVQEKEEQESSGVGVGIGAEGVSEVPHH